MSISNQSATDKAGSRYLAWCVHFYTATGLILSLLSARAIVERDALQAVFLMAIAMFIDGTDGNLARRWQAKKWLPQFDGRKLDDIVDFLTYTFIPVFFLQEFKIVSWPWSLTLFVALLASAYGFCNSSAKTDDGFFTGFPSYWNGVALYLYWLDWPDWIAGMIVLVFAVFTFVPSKYISLNQTVQLRTLNRILFLAWILVLIVILLDFENPNQPLILISLLYPLFYFSSSVYLTYQTNDREH